MDHAIGLVSLAARDGAQCTPHNDIITSLWKYNVFAVVLSLVSNLFGYFILRKRRSSTTDRRQLVPGKAAIYIVGHLALAVVGAYLTGLVIERSCPSGFRCPSAAYGLLIWATRPRATAAVFLVNLPFALWLAKNAELDSPRAPVIAWSADAQPGRELDLAGNDSNWDAQQKHVAQTRAYSAVPTALPDISESERPERRGIFRIFGRRKMGIRENVFFKTCVTTCVVEFFVCFIGVPTWVSPATRNTPPSQPDSKVNRFTCLFEVQGMDKITGTSHFATCTPAANSLLFIAAIGMLAGFTLFALSGVIVVSCSKKRRCDPFLPAWVGPWVCLTTATVFTWIMWVTFLKDTPDADYCIGNLMAVDAVNFVYIVVLNLWRQAV